MKNKFICRRFCIAVKIIMSTCALMIFFAVLPVLPSWAGLNQWTSNGPDDRIDSIAFSSNYLNDHVIFASKGRCCDGYTSNSYKSEDSGSSWSLAGPGGVLAISPQYPADQTVFTGGNQYTIFKSTNGGSSWVDLNTSAGSCLGDMAISPNYHNDLTVFATSSGVHKTSNGGISWIQKNTGLTETSNGLLAVSPDFENDHTLFYGGHDKGVFKSTNGGDSWISVSTGLPQTSGYSGPSIDSLAISPNFASDHTLFVAVWTHGIFKSTDGGMTWDRVNSLAYWTAAIAISPHYGTDQTIFAGTEYFNGSWEGVLKSSDGGATWVQLGTDGFPLSPVLAIGISPSYTFDETIFAGTWDGVWSFSATTPIWDVSSNNWAYDYIHALYDAGITSGCTQDPLNYCPSNNVSRQEMAAFIIRALFGETFPYSEIPYFGDVPASNQFFKYIQKMKEENITIGCTVSEYCPTAPVTREQMAAFLIRALHGESFTNTTTPFFSDVPYGVPFFNYIQMLRDEGITTGCSPAKYCPKLTVTRAEMAAFLIRAFPGLQ